jgi:hypothetical protein
MSKWAALAFLVLLGCHREIGHVVGDAPLLGKESSCKLTVDESDVRRVLHSGDSVVVLDRYYHKDYLCLQLRTSDGVIGYMLADKYIELHP